MKTLVIDTEIPEFQANRVLDKQYAQQFPGATVFSSIAEIARVDGWHVSTADVFLQDVHRNGHSVTLSNEFTPFLPMLIERGVVPGILISGESPIVAKEFYRDLTARSGSFRHAVLFKGCLSHLSPSVNGHVWRWPCPNLVASSNPAWSQRRLLAYVAGFKGVWLGPRARLRKLIQTAIGLSSGNKDLSNKTRELYDTRWSLVKAFAQKGEFTLQGKGWHRTTKGHTRWWRRGIRYANEPVPCEDKVKLLSSFRFGLAVENVSFPGYVTEKIYDVLRAGSVPVYIGAPDIADYVPLGAFIDGSKFTSPAHMWRSLESMTENQWDLLRIEGVKFLRTKFYHEQLDYSVAKQWMRWISESRPPNGPVQC